jgi:hypothetical protein
MLACLRDSGAAGPWTRAPGAHNGLAGVLQQASCLDKQQQLRDPGVGKTLSIGLFALLRIRRG